MPSAIASPIGEWNNQRNASVPAIRDAKPQINGTI